PLIASLRARCRRGPYGRRAGILPIFPRVLARGRKPVQEGRAAPTSAHRGADDHTSALGYKRPNRPPTGPCMTDTTPSSALEQRLRDGRFVLTAEVVPPAACDADALLQKARPLAGLADAVNVTDGAGARAHMGATAAAAILQQHGIEAILQLACRDRHRLALQGEMMGAAAVGIRDLLLLRGDDPTQGDQKDAKPVFDLDSRGLMEMARAMRDTGALPHGQKIAGKPDFFLGAADAPIDPPAGWQPTTLAGKIS